MSEDTRSTEGQGGSAEEARGSSWRSARGRVSDGLQRGMGALSAFKDSLGETIHEARERGDLSVDRAKEVVKGAVDRARDATSGARNRFDFVTFGDLEGLIRRVQELEARLDGGAPPAAGGAGGGAGPSEPGGR